MTRSEMRERAEAMIEYLINILDILDGDPDAESDADSEMETDENLSPVNLQSIEYVPARQIRRRAA